MIKFLTLLVLQSIVFTIFFVQMPEYNPANVFISKVPGVTIHYELGQCTSVFSNKAIYDTVVDCYEI